MPAALLQFWFHEIPPAKWWKVDADFDQLIVERFSGQHTPAVGCELFEWRAEPNGRLAEIIVLGQFSRNIFRGDKRAFPADALALSPEQRVFLYMPYLHSEARPIHEIAERLIKALGQPGNYDFELRHKAIIDQFGRYPHRNAMLGRPSTQDELAFLAKPGSGF